VKIQLLAKSHNRKDFTCEENSLTEYIRKQVSQDIRKRLATCFVAVDSEKMFLPMNVIRQLVISLGV